MLPDLLPWNSAAKKRRKTNIPILWRPPPTNWIKLNCDGASKGNPSHVTKLWWCVKRYPSPCGGRGGRLAIRDNAKQLLMARGSYYGVETNMWAEGEAALEGIKMAMENLSLPIQLESGYLILIQVINRTTKCPIDMAYYSSHLENNGTHWD